MKQEKDKKYQLPILFDVMYESQKKCRELKNIAIDPKFIIEEEEKRQPLSSKSSCFDLILNYHNVL